MNDSTYTAVLGEAPALPAMAQLLFHGPKLLVVSCGARGALAASAGEALAQAALAALRFACGAGSIAIGATGARSALPDRPTLDRLLAQAPAAELQISRDSTC